jgi:hypothetical protein
VLCILFFDHHLSFRFCCLFVFYLVLYSLGVYDIFHLSFQINEVKLFSKVKQNIFQSKLKRMLTSNLVRTTLFWNYLHPRKTNGGQNNLKRLLRARKQLIVSKSSL